MQLMIIISTFVETKLSRLWIMYTTTSITLLLGSKPISVLGLVIQSVLNDSKIYSHIANSVFNNHLRSSNRLSYTQNHVIKNHVIKRLRCIELSWLD